MFFWYWKWPSVCSIGVKHKRFFGSRPFFPLVFRFLSCYKLGSFLHHQMLQELFSLPLKINKITGGSSNISVRRKIYSLLMSAKFQMRFSVFVDFLSGFSVLPPNFVRFCGFENPSRPPHKSWWKHSILKFHSQIWHMKGNSRPHESHCRHITGWGK